MHWGHAEAAVGRVHAATSPLRSTGERPKLRLKILGGVFWAPPIAVAPDRLSAGHGWVVADYSDASPERRESYELPIIREFQLSRFFIRHRDYHGELTRVETDLDRHDATFDVDDRYSGNVVRLFAVNQDRFNLR